MLIGVEGEGGDYQKLHRVEVAALLTTAGDKGAAGANYQTLVI